MTYLAIDRARRASTDWEWTEFRRVAQLRRTRNVRSDRQLLSVSAEFGVRPRPDDGGRQLPTNETVAGYWHVEPDDLVFNPMWAIEGGVAVASIGGAVSTAYRVYRLNRALHPKFVHYYSRSQIALAQYRLMVRGVTTFDRSVTREDFEAMPFPAPPIDQQRAIADILDAETARIDALIVKKRRMMELLIDRFRGEVGARTGDGTLHRVRFVTSLITSGPRGWGDRAGEAGVPFIRSGNLRKSSLDLNLDDLARVEPPQGAESDRARVREGDVLIGITGANTGWVGVVGPEAADGFVSQHVAIIRPAGVESEWLGYCIYSDRAQSDLLGSQYGGTKQQLGLSELAGLAVHVPSPAVQREHLRALHGLRSRLVATQVLLHRQIELLREHRQALITAAVTGDLAVPGVAA